MAGNAGRPQQKQRTRKALLQAAAQLTKQGGRPTLEAIAEEALVSRATAYRYFPTQASMIQSAVGEALGPILGWRSDSADAEERTTELVGFAYPRIEAYEATHRATVLLSLDQWTRRHAGTLGDEAQIRRGHRKKLLADAVAPLKAGLRKPAFDRLLQSLSLVFGTEALIVLKDIWGLDGGGARRVAVWAANALVRAAATEATTRRNGAGVKGGTRRASAAAPKGKSLNEHEESRPGRPTAGRFRV